MECLPKLNQLDVTFTRLPFQDFKHGFSRRVDITRCNEFYAELGDFEL